MTGFSNGRQSAGVGCPE